MQVKLYKIMGVTPSGGHWFLAAEEFLGGIGGDWTDYTLFAKDKIDMSDSYSSREDAERQLRIYKDRYLQSFSDPSRARLWAYCAHGDRRALRITGDRLTMSVVEFTAEV